MNNQIFTATAFSEELDRFTLFSAAPLDLHEIQVVSKLYKISEAQVGQGVAILLVYTGSACSGLGIPVWGENLRLINISQLNSVVTDDLTVFCLNSIALSRFKVEDGTPGTPEADAIDVLSSLSQEHYTSLFKVDTLVVFVGYDQEIEMPVTSRAVDFSLAPEVRAVAPVKPPQQEADIQVMKPPVLEGHVAGIILPDIEEEDEYAEQH